MPRGWNPNNAIDSDLGQIISTLYLYVLVYKMGEILVPTSELGRLRALLPVTCLEQHLTHYKFSINVNHLILTTHAIPPFSQLISKSAFHTPHTQMLYVTGYYN